ncbi:stalk domain-containing protein [Paenibacillus nicotianae]|uniref:Stalk domain-containing protein n=1 Tax=Paenibacillus nicotianae TaxID=1526551 RepID=A0ABW4URH0_9BACL
MKSNHKGIVYFLIVMLGLVSSSAGIGISSVHAATTSQNPDPKQAFAHMVFLGDSITAGYEPGVKAANYDGFAPRVAEQGLFRASVQSDNHSILGLTSTGLDNYLRAITAGSKITTNDVQTNLPGAVYTLDTTQAKKDIAQADLITITIGGNDFLNALGSLSALPQDISTLNLDQVGTKYNINIDNIIKQVTALNPKATIVVADQYQPMPAQVGTKLYAGLNTVADQFSQIVDQTAKSYVAKGYDVRVAHISKDFPGKELAMTHIAEGDIHPNQTGYDAIARTFIQTIWGSKGYLTPFTKGQSSASTTPAIVTKGQPLSTTYKPVIRNGKTYVTLRDVTTALGATVNWSNASQTATIKNGKNNISIPVNSQKIKVNGATQTIANPAFVQTNKGISKVYVPLTVLTQAFDYDVQYVARWKAVFIR